MNTSSAAANKTTYLAFVLGATMITGAVMYIFYKCFKRDKMPVKWRRVGTLEQINLFPIKSCARLDLFTKDEVSCDVLGLRFRGIRDRSLMLVNENNEMVTARVYPKLVLVVLKVVGETTLLIIAKDMKPLEIDFATLPDIDSYENIITTSVWGSKLDVVLCGKKYDKWFSQYILNKETGLRLAHYPHIKPVRSTNSRLVKEPFIIQEDSGTLGDATSYSLINLASVNDLNSRLTKTTVDALQFRGNFHLKMDIDIAYAEDDWQWVRIGDDAVFRKIAPCTRCILPNINTKTGERDADGNPLKILKSYRLLHNHASPTLGIHLGLRQAGTIKANDVIYVEDI